MALKKASILERPGIVLQRVLLHSMHPKIGACQEEFPAANCSLVTDSSSIFAGQNSGPRPKIGNSLGFCLEFSGILLRIPLEEVRKP